MFTNDLFSKFQLLVDSGSKTTGGFLDESEDDDLEELVAQDEDDSDLDESPDEEDQPEGKKEQKTFTQDDLNQILGERLFREKQKAEAEKAALLEQQRQEAELKARAENRYGQLIKRYMDTFAYDEDTAKDLAAEELRKELLLEKLTQEVESQKKTSAYSQHKAEVIAKNPIAGKYIKEIDAFSQNGKILDFETAMYYVLGQKMASSGLINDIRATEQQKTLAAISSKRRAAVETDSMPGDASRQISLSKDEKRLAKNLGISPSDWAKHQKKSKR